MYIVYFFIFIFGATIGSFLNVCIFRIPRGQSIVFPPSHCINCGTKLSWHDMFPIISWILLRGKCRFCKSEISYRYPLVELITGIIFLAIYLKYGFTYNTIKFCFFVSLILVIGIIDLDTTEVYNSTIITGIVSFILLTCVNFILFKANFITKFSFFNYILGGIIGAIFIVIIIVATRGMGFGDAEICLVCGLFLGSKNIIFMLFLSVVIGGLMGIGLILFKKKSRQDYIPFGPFIVVSSVVTILFGGEIINWYMCMI